MRFLVFILGVVLCISCEIKSTIQNDFDCETISIHNSETVEDVKGLFSLAIPNHWEINLYEDAMQSSIFTADTTKQLTKTVMLDVTLVENSIQFDEAFELKQEQEYLLNKLIKIKSKTFTVAEKPALYMLFKGKKGKFNYQICNTFIKLNTKQFIVAKAEVYGDSLIDERLCRAFSIVENINLNNTND
jgi:hypothetical protein